MPLALQFSVCEAKDLESFDVVDDTGVYNVATNPGGYGAPNPAIADFATAVLEVTLPGATTAVTVNVFPTLPNITSVPFTVTSALLGVSGELPDGVYHINYRLTVTVGPFIGTYQLDCYFAVLGQAERCVDGKVAAIDICTVDDCTDKALWELSKLVNMLDSAKAAACCGKITEAGDIIDYVNDKCGNLEDCGCN